MTEPTPESKPEKEWTEEASERMGKRAEMLGASAGFAKVTVWVDPDDETPERPAGLEERPPVAILDLTGHIHPPMAAVEAGLAPPCIPVKTGWALEPDMLDDLIEELADARAELTRRLAAYRG